MDSKKLDSYVESFQQIREDVCSMKININRQINSLLTEKFVIDGSEYSFRSHFTTGFRVLKDDKEIMQIHYDDMFGYALSMDGQNETLRNKEITPILDTIQNNLDIGFKKRKLSEDEHTKYCEFYSAIGSLAFYIRELDMVLSCITNIRNQLYLFK